MNSEEPVVADESPRVAGLESSTPAAGSDLALVLVFGATMFASALLLFLVQPLAARLLLPRLGGSPAVWNTSLVFFQVMLLAGYAYAFLTTRWLPARWQTFVQLGVAGLAIATLPIGIPSDWLPPAESNPAPWLLGTLLLRIGAAYFALAATAPLLQRWFGATRHRSAADPYFLYAVSNLGSLAALVGYPLVVEPLWGLDAQTHLWSWGFALFGGLTMVSAGMLWLFPGRQSTSLSDEQAIAARSTEGAGARLWRERLYWLALAAVPTSWMLAVTTHITTDLTPVPLLWVAPLALFLLTYIIAFAPQGARVRPVVQMLFPIAVILLAVSLLCPGHWQLLGIDLGAFVVGALACHGELAHRRPGVERLTEFYLWISIGGAVGGVVNALVAPLVFSTVAEYPLTVGLACLLVPSLGRSRDAATRMAWLGGAILISALLLRTFPITAPRTEVYLIAAATAALVALYWLGLTRWFAPLVAALMWYVQATPPMRGELLETDRSFFGVHRVMQDDATRPVRFRRLLHGTTLHGMQYVDSRRACEPIGYYTRSGPLGETLAALEPRQGEVQQVAVLGLGTGGGACYAGPQRFMTFYEIDPLVLRLANQYFKHLPQCGEGCTEVILGDGRLQLAAAPDEKYDIIWLDAFSSDAIPVHLLTREALALYLQKLKPHGVLIYHISNKHLDLAPVAANLAADAGLQARIRNDRNLTREDLAAGKAPSTFAVLSRRAADVGALASSPEWKLLEPDRNARVWSDDYSNVLGVLKWGSQNDSDKDEKSLPQLP